jgi:hypothetical protein
MHLTYQGGWNKKGQNAKFLEKSEFKISSNTYRRRETAMIQPHLKNRLNKDTKRSIRTKIQRKILDNQEYNI